MQAFVLRIKKYKEIEFERKKKQKRELAYVTYINKLPVYHTAMIIR